MSNEVFTIIMRMSHLYHVNYSYLVGKRGSPEALVIDPAWEIEKIEAALTRTNTNLCGILLTHAHFDHTHLVEPLAKKYNCPVWMSNDEIADSGYIAPQLTGINDTPWTAGQLQIEPIITPGHTVGSTCYLIGDNLFTGDTLFSEGCGICSNIEAAFNMYQSLRDLVKRIEPQTNVYPGHSFGKPPGQKLAVLLKENIYLQFTNKEDFSAYRLRKRQSIPKFTNYQ